VTIAINPWPGYEFLYLAQQKGFFAASGANVEMVQLMSLGDAQRAYVNGRVDGLSSTLIEAVQAEHLGGQPLQVVLVADYSNGGDVILASREIENVAQLKGKTVGCEVSSLGIVMLQRALSKAGLSLSDVTVLNTEQSAGQELLDQGRIDAFVSYSPFSVNVLKDSRYHTIFSSAEIPFEIIDTVAIASSVLEQHPHLVASIHQAWQMALDYSAHHPDEAHEIMARREGISVEDFREVLSTLALLDINKQRELFSNPQIIEASAKSVCDTLVQLGSLEGVDCEKQHPLMYRGEL
jgi:NitT/TauT family transport system substrate-binding protein